MQAHSTTRKRDAQSALVLTGPARLSVSRGRLLVEDGFGNLGTRRTLEFEPPLSLQSVLLLTNGGTWSDHALRMLAQNGVTLYSLRQTGEIDYFILPPDGPIKPGLLRLQASLPDTELGLTLSKSLIVKKIEGQEKTLVWLAQKAALPGLAEYVCSKTLFSSSAADAKTLDMLRLAEARAADAYFSAWKNMPIAFQKPAKGCVDVPSHWRRFEGRQSLRTKQNQDATNPLNALLNFSYAVAAAETLLCCRAASLEPSLGLLHMDKDGRASFVYDLMEPLRPLVDRWMLELVASRTFRMNQDFLLLKEGVCRLGIELAAEVGKQVSERLRPEAERLVQQVRQSLLSVATTTYRVPRALMADEKQTEETQAEETATAGEPVSVPVASASLPLPNGRKPASPKGICCRCGVKVSQHARFCEPCRSERYSEIWQEQWQKRKESGVDTSHGGEAAKKRSEAMARSHLLKPRGKQAQPTGQ
jgi:CRISPR-associated endonuclease Cas1